MKRIAILGSTGSIGRQTLDVIRVNPDRFEVIGLAAGLRRLIVTASGGALRDLPLDALAAVGPAEALAHPTWSMGRRITVDSATLFNKGLEVIEAHWLFDVPFEKIDVVMHRESIIHSMVEMVDGSVFAQLSYPDMRAPILYALSHPERLALDLPSL